MSKRLSNGPLQPLHVKERLNASAQSFNPSQGKGAKHPGTMMNFMNKNETTKLHKVSINEVVKSLNRKAHPAFGIEGYELTRTDIYTNRPLTTKFS